jgi:hypothetical protein
MEKLSRLLQHNPDIISVGDSSGFFSLQSTIINRYLGGRRYVNLSTGANQAFDGYKAIAEFALQRTPSIKFVVLHMFPQLVPSPTALRVSGLAPILQDNLISFRSWLTPPSAALSPHAKVYLFDGRIYRRGEALSNHKVALEFRATADFTDGWVPEHDVRFDRLFGTTPFFADQREDWMHYLPGVEQSTINYVLSDFERMVSKYGAKLIIAFGPIPERSVIPNDASRHRAEQELERFQKEHPNVTFLFPLITPFTNDKFGQFNHIAREYTFLSSKRLGLALREALDDPQAVARFVAQNHDRVVGPKPEFQVTGEASVDLRDAATAFFLYTATTDAQFRKRISKRVLSLLDRDTAFDFMMADGAEKIALMSRVNQRLRYSIDELSARPITVKNIGHCNVSDPTLQWVRLSGTMMFAYDDPERHSAEPVAWPDTSNIFVPIVTEDGVTKFDGYCLEPSMAPFSN